MSTQVIFNREKALNAGMRFEAVTEEYWDYCDDGSEHKREMRYEIVHFEEIATTNYMDVEEQKVMVDANYYGTIRGVLLPWLQQHGITYKEV